MKWWDTSWNPVVGCTPISKACDNCYAKRLHDQRHVAYLAGKNVPACYEDPFEVVNCLMGRLDAPLHWRKPRRVFVNSMSDLFHEGVLNYYLDRVFMVMALCPQHTFMICTKRPERMRQYVPHATRTGYPMGRVQFIESLGFDRIAGGKALASALDNGLPNVWLGTSIWDQQSAEENLYPLMDTPAAKYFVSYEPALGPVDLTFVQTPHGSVWNTLDRLDWVICGGETGAGARPMHPDWARSLRDQRKGAGVPFFFKQGGGWKGITAFNGRLLDGREHNDIPESPHA